MQIRDVSFIKSAAELSQAPADGRPQLAVAGRSNVGKSTLINYLLGRRSLAKTSGRPGHTRLLNFFLVNQLFYLVDLPGYGYAAVDRKTRGDWGEMVHAFLEQHPDLKVMLLLMDLRRQAESEELSLMAWLEQQGLPYFVVLTKIDKLKPQARASRLAAWRRELGAEGYGRQLLPVSAHLRQGRDPIWAALAPYLSSEAADPE